ncbi:unnamed protein product [Oppiella nova]|uniref:Vps16 C-terminal domain-containing protein n=1 Tax=Oppiella nova TaxID=334625 RepID=A0A7R9Q9K1_9ACAR|nr:unnamed protein product [Oppiella nova]CAG2161178.1 unnamed protein product [Oppiella nova]
MTTYRISNDVDEDYWTQTKAYRFDFDDQTLVESSSVVGSESSEATIDEVLGLSGSASSGARVAQSLDEGLAESVVSAQIDECLQHMKSQETSVGSKRSPQHVINSLSKGIDIDLHEYKGKEDKLELLDTALHTNEGNAIISVVLHLKRTTKDSIFNYELSRRSLAADHYLFYLRQNKRMTELVDTLSMLGRHEEAAITAYSQAIACRDIDTKVHNLKSCLRNHFTSGGNDCIFWNNYISEQISLLELQLPIESDDRRQEREGHNQLFTQTQRTPLIDLPVLSTLYYCCLFHYCLSENHLASPKAICKAFYLSDQQFVWTALSALAQTRQWLQIDTLFEYKSWLGNKRLKCCIGFDKVVLLLHRNGAPLEVLNKYLQTIDNLDTKFNLAKEMKHLELAIDQEIGKN